MHRVRWYSIRTRLVWLAAAVWLGAGPWLEGPVYQ
jgi:hypothetical protein